MLRLLEVNEMTCKRCGRKWFAKVVNPKRCAHCKSPYWNKDKLKHDDADAVNKYHFNTWELGVWHKIENFTTPDGRIDTVRNATRWRALAQFARRNGYKLRFNGNTGALLAMLEL